MYLNILLSTILNKYPLTKYSSMKPESIAVKIVINKVNDDNLKVFNKEIIYI